MNLTEDVLLDRLVDGELDGEERRNLLVHLDVTPDGWKRCALAFLEAQAWREVLKAPSPMHARRPIVSPSRLAFAASLVAAFGAGWLSHPRPAETPQSMTVAARPVEHESPAKKEPPPTEPEPPAPAPVQPRPADVLVKSWERKGFHVERQQRLASLEVPDGGRHQVPVQEIKLRYIGDRTF
jgi:hypothetical protein